MFCPDAPQVVNLHLAELRANGVHFLSKQDLARAIVLTLPYDTFQTPERYAEALLRAHDELVEVGV